MVGLIIMDASLKTISHNWVIVVITVELQDIPTVCRLSEWQKPWWSWVMFEGKLLRVKTRWPPGIEACHEELTDLADEKQVTFQRNALSEKNCKDLGLTSERSVSSLADRNQCIVLLDPTFTTTSVLHTSTHHLSIYLKPKEKKNICIILHFLLKQYIVKQMPSPRKQVREQGTYYRF